MDVKRISIFPLARLGPLGVLTTIAAISTLYILTSGQFAKAWVAAGFVPLAIYLGHCHLRARKMVLAERGREREIVKMSFVSMAADRATRFWNLLFSAIAVSTAVTTVAIWAYQGFISYVDGRWIPLTWAAVVQEMPRTDSAAFQRLIYWLGDTNFGVVVLIGGLLLAAPLAAINWRSHNKAKRRRNEFSSLKKRS